MWITVHDFFMMTLSKTNGTLIKTKNIQFLWIRTTYSNKMILILTCAISTMIQVIWTEWSAVASIRKYLCTND